MIKKNLQIGVLCILIISNLTMCDIIRDCPECFTPPEPLRLRLVNKLNSTDLVASGYFSKDSIRIYYFDNNLRKDIDVKFQTDIAQEKSIIFSDEIAWKSIGGTKEYYIQLNSKDLDTLFLDVVSKSDNCCTYHPLNHFKYNGKEVELDGIEYLFKIEK